MMFMIMIDYCQWNSDDEKYQTQPKLQQLKVTKKIELLFKTLTAFLLMFNPGSALLNLISSPLGSNLLEESQRSSWADLSSEAQSRAASALLTQLEENAFLLADAVTKEKTILQIVNNICKYFTIW